MAKNLPEIPKCKICGNQVIGISGNICRVCQLKKTQENYMKAIKAEQEISGSNNWLKGYSPWKNIVAIPLVITLLILFVIAIFFIAR